MTINTIYFKKLLTQTSVRDKIYTERVISMLEVFKSKMMLAFMFLVIMLVFVDCSFNNKLEEKNTENLIVLNS